MSSSGPPLHLVNVWGRVTMYHWEAAVRRLHHTESCVILFIRGSTLQTEKPICGVKPAADVFGWPKRTCRLPTLSGTFAPARVCRINEYSSVDPCLFSPCGKREQKKKKKNKSLYPSLFTTGQATVRLLWFSQRVKEKKAILLWCGFPLFPPPTGITHWAKVCALTPST